jgi:hypothetical protein
VHLALDIQNGNRAHVFDIHYEDIRIEDPITDYFFQGPPDSPQKQDPMFTEKAKNNMGFPIGIFVYEETFWSKDNAIGKVSDIHYRNIYYTSEYTPQLVFKGYGSEHEVAGITLENLIINGKKALSLSDINVQTNDYVKNITFK